MDAANIEMVPAPPSPPSSHDFGDRSYRDIHEIEVAIPSIPAPPSPRSSYDSGDRSYRDIHEIEVAIPSIPSPQRTLEPDAVLDDDDGAIPSIPSPHGSHEPDDVLDDDDGDDDINSFFSFPNSPQQPLPSLNMMERAGRWWRMHREYRPWWVFGFLVGIIIVLVVLLTVHILLSRRAKTCKIEILVSKNGNKGFRTISDALEASPSYSNDQVCIIIKGGEYHEMINIGEDKTNIILKGAGIDRTVIISNESLDVTVHNQPATATLWIKGDWFLARDMTIARTGNGGVAVENWSDYSIFYNCKLKGVNGSLNAKRGNQFYRSCEVYGQNYLISGYTAVFFQKSNFFAEKLYASEKTVYSTQTSLLLGSNSGFTFHQCSFYIVGSGHVKNTSAAFLGELLGKYSRIVVIQSYLDESIDYVLVNNTFPNTAEILIFNNFGPGASRKNTSSHVKEIGDIKAASTFSLRVFLDKRQWKLPKIDYNLDLSV